MTDGLTTRAERLGANKAAVPKDGLRYSRL